MFIACIVRRGIRWDTPILNRRQSLHVCHQQRFRVSAGLCYDLKTDSICLHKRCRTNTWAPDSAYHDGYTRTHRRLGTPAYSHPYTVYFIYTSGINREICLCHNAVRRHRIKYRSVGLLRCDRKMARWQQQTTRSEEEKQQIICSKMITYAKLLFLCLLEETAFPELF